MAKKSAPPIEVKCPCCEAMLTVDTELAVVLSHVAPPRAAPDVDISDAARILAEQAKKREDKFRDSWEAESKKEEDHLLFQGIVGQHAGPGRPFDGHIHEGDQH